MRPVLTVEAMRRADRAALAEVDEAVLVRRAGTAVAACARRMLGTTYGRRVVVVAGKGNNGADGRVAAALLARRGARVLVVDPPDGGGPPDPLPPCDLVVDAAYGTGFRGTYRPPPVPDGVPVLAVDIPSGIPGDSGVPDGQAVVATRTVAMAALKLGHLQGDGRRHSGAVEVADIGIAVDDPPLALVEDADVARLLPPRAAQGHKWDSAVAVVAGSPGMEGAGTFSARGASRAGAGMVRLCVPGRGSPEGGTRPGPWPLEAVRLALPAEGWAGPVLEVLGRCRALVVGPGLGRGPAVSAAVRALVAGSPVPVVADADALVALGGADEVAALDRPAPLILTPHDGEYRGLAGEDPGPDRVGAATRLADRTGAVVLLKGSLTVVAAPGTTPVLLAAAGSPRLATAGTGDVLSGVIGALVARGVDPAPAAALGAHVHGRAASLGFAEGLTAGDLPDLVATWLSGHGPAAGPGSGKVAAAW